jgi:glutamate synthase domain-containing protein 3
MSDEQHKDKAKNTVYMPGTWVQLDSKGIHYKDLNRRIRSLVQDGARNIEVRNVFGQRYIGTNLFGTQREGMRINIHGTPGSDLGAFMDGPIIEVFGNVQDATGNTMNSGRILVHGSAGDVLGYGMRGGEIYVRGNVGYRVGIHMKEYFHKIPTIVIGGTVQDFFGEYMAGGRIIVLNKFFEDNPPSRLNYFIGTGMHGGVIYIHGEVDLRQIGAEVGVASPTTEETAFIEEKVQQFGRYFGLPDAPDRLRDVPVLKLFPKSTRPYGDLYAY